MLVWTCNAERSALETFQKRRRVNSPAGGLGIKTVLWKASTTNIVRIDGFVELVMIASAGAWDEQYKDAVYVHTTGPLHPRDHAPSPA